MARLIRPCCELPRGGPWRQAGCWTIKRENVRRCEALPEEPDAGVTRADEILASAAAGEFRALLKPTQRAVLDCLLDGLTWREAGRVLGCTSANIAYYVRQIRRLYQQWSEGT